MRVRTLLGKEMNILNIEVSETREGKMNRKSVIMVNLKHIMEGEREEIN